MKPPKILSHDLSIMCPSSRFGPIDDGQPFMCDRDCLNGDFRKTIDVGQHVGQVMSLKTNEIPLSVHCLSSISKKKKRGLVKATKGYARVKGHVGQKVFAAVLADSTPPRHPA